MFLNGTKISKIDWKQNLKVKKKLKNKQTNI